MTAGDPVSAEAPSSVLGARMAVDSDGPLPTIASLGLEEAKKQAFEWQKQRGLAKWNDLAGTLTGRSGARWVVETHAILGVVAEQVLVAVELEVEKEIVRQAIDNLAGSDKQHKASVLAHYSRSLRFFAEAQANAIVIGLHGLANVGARTLEFDAELSVTELQSLKAARADFAPGSSARAAWLSWTGGLVGRVVSMAAARTPEMQLMAAELAAIASEPAIVDLLELRNTQYHRWRGESAGVTGIALGELPAADVLASGQAVSFGTELLPPYVEGQATLDELDVVGRSSLDAFVSHMDSFLTAWGATLPQA